MHCEYKTLIRPWLQWHNSIVNISGKAIAVDPRVAVTLRLIADNPKLKVPAAMWAAKFTTAESEEARCQMWIRRRLPAKSPSTKPSKSRNGVRWGGSWTRRRSQKLQLQSLRRRSQKLQLQSQCDIIILMLIYYVLCRIMHSYIRAIPHHTMIFIYDNGHQYAMTTKSVY
jgi:hypothetical protein